MSRGFQGRPPLTGSRGRAPGLLLLALLSSCKVRPDYQRPDTPITPTYKELPGWSPAQPRDAIDRGAWWSIYDDPTLDALERRVAIDNQTLKASEAAFRASVAAVIEARAQLFPTAGVTASVQRRAGGGSSGATTLTSPSLNALSGGSVGGTTGNGTLTTTTSGNGNTGGVARTITTVEGTVDWELDLWGRIRRQVESNVAAAQASAADIATARLSAQSQLAIDYFALRAADSLAALLTDTVRDYERSLQITRNQYAAGVAARADVITAQTQLAGAQSQLVNAGVQRAQLEHAIAVLTGQPPGAVALGPAPLPKRVPVVPAGVPSELLQRRPDIATAERDVQAQNALIGVAVAAYYPAVTLSALYGFSGNPISSLISVGNRVWSLGASASETLFEGGARTGAVLAARANYDQAVANYRGVALSAFQGVEDQLSTLRILAQQAEVQDQAVQLAGQSVRIALNQYRAGTVPYTTVITQQAILLSDQQAALAIQQNRLVASVTLIEALGGGWQEADLPSRSDLQRFNPLLP